MNGRLAAFLLFATLRLSAQVGDRADVDRSLPPEHWKLPDGRVYTPAETVGLLDVPEGFRVDVVAAEPLVQDPIAIQFDERGRIWVLEWPGYNWKLRDVIPGLEKMEAPKGRVVILEDTDGDGRMDRRSIFLDGLEWPRGLQVTGDGALIMALPQIILARDSNGDGKADQLKVIVTGLEVPANPHAAQNTLLRAMDNWIYLNKVPQRLRWSEGKWISRPSLTSRGQWGLSQDNYGRLVYASNGDHLRGDLVPAHYFTRNPNYDVTAGVDVKYPADQFVWPQGPTPGINRRAQLRDEDGALQMFTSNTGPCVYRGDQFPPEYVGNVFLGEVAGRFMRRDVLTEKDGAITARNAYERREFLYSRDERVRAVCTTNGPDGALYVADMHRGIIEGEIFVTSFLRQQIVSRGLQHPFFGLGRIYRISHRGNVPGTRPVVPPGDVTAWIEHLAHPNGFWRDTAQRLLVEARNLRVVPALEQMVEKHPDELARLHALWTLDGLDRVGADVVRTALRDRSPHVRVAALRVSESLLGNDDVLAAVLKCAADERIEVRRQLMFTLGEGQGEVIDRARLALLRRDAPEPIMVEAALSGLHGRESALLDQLLKDSGWRNEAPGLGRFLSALAQATANAGNDEALESLLRRIAALPADAGWARLTVMDGLKAARKRQLARIPDALAPLEKSADAEVSSRAAALRKTWSEPPAPDRAGRGPAGAVFERGREMFAICAACHGPEGKGQPSIAPPLEGSAIVAGSEEELLRSILQGRNLDRSNKAFPDMPPLAGLPDADIAAVASYVRGRWGNATRAVTMGQVTQARASTGGTAPATPAAGSPR